MTKTIKIKGIEVEIDIIQNDSVKKATAIVSIQDATSEETLSYVPCNEGDEWEAYEDQIMFGLEEWVIETKAKAVSRLVSEITMKALIHNLSQNKTKVSIEYCSIDNVVIITVWGNFVSMSDRVGKLLHLIKCPTTGNNEYDQHGVDGEYDLYKVWDFIKELI
jgi:hypothetical protein